MVRNLSEVEQRMIGLLKVDSRKNISDLAASLGISRVTAKKLLDGLVDEGMIKSFTITLDNEGDNLVLVDIEDISEVPKELILDDYELIDGKHILVLYYENLPKIRSAKILSVRIVVKKTTVNPLGRMELIHCDLCGKEIAEQPIIITLSKKVYYACCSTCEKGLKRRISLTAT